MIDYIKKILKGNTKNKFIFLIIIIIIIILWIQSYISKSSVKWDSNSYVILVKWEAHLSEITLHKNRKQQLKIGDIIETIGSESIAVIEWWDKSITRIWWNSKLQVNELNVKKDLSKINIIFTLQKWKTWSSVVSFLWEKSYFKENFHDLEASVRGTTFNIDLSKNYLFVKHHEVSLKKDNKKIIVKENNALNIQTFSFIKLSQFMRRMKDHSWEKLNKKLDSQYINNLKTQAKKVFTQKNLDTILEKSIWKWAKNLQNFEKDISNFSDEKRKKIYQSLLTQYQKLNFISSQDAELYKTKNQIKGTLISLAWENDKKTLLKYSLYDLKDAISIDGLSEWKKQQAIKTTLALIQKNIKSVDINDYNIFTEVNLSPEYLKKILWEQWWSMKNILEKAQNISLQDVWDFSKKTLDASSQTLIESGIWVWSEAIDIIDTSSHIVDISSKELLKAWKEVGNSTSNILKDSTSWLINAWRWLSTEFINNFK